MKKTARNFWYHEMIDFYRRKFVLQDSSIATDLCVWIYPRDGVPGGMIHLNRRQAKRVISILQTFVETGSICKRGYRSL